MTDQEIQEKMDLIFKKLDLIASKIEWGYYFELDGTKKLVFLKDSEDWE